MAVDFQTTLGTEIEKGIGPLSSLNGSGFERTTLRYPIDLGSSEKGHYIVFYARVQKDTQYPYTPGSASELQVSGIAVNKIEKKGLPSRTVLTTDAIALYMPDTILYGHEQSYEVLSPGTEKLGSLIQAGKSVMDEYKAGGKEARNNAIKKNASLWAGSQVAGALGQTGQLGFTAATGTVVNPILEMIYRSPNFRSFQFDFMFYPRSTKEAEEVQNILERFRYHQSPELLKGAEGFLIPPSEFDIIFYYNGSQNPNIPPIATCVLMDIQINYAPNGWAAYEDNYIFTPALGGTGMPVAIQMTLSFKETTYLTKDDYRATIGQTTQAV